MYHKKADFTLSKFKQKENKGIVSHAKFIEEIPEYATSWQNMILFYKKSEV